MSAWRPRVLWLLVVALAGLAWLLPPIAQPSGYYDFADQRACWGLLNCLDSASNTLLVVAAGLGSAAWWGWSEARGRPPGVRAAAALY